MRTALARAVGAPTPDSLLLLLTALLLGSAVLLSDGSDDGKLFPVGSVALLVAGCAVAAVLLGYVRAASLDRLGVAFFACLGGFVVWNGLSVLWSVQPDRSWDYFNRGLVYLAFALLGFLVAPLVPRGARGAAVALAAVLAVALLVALLDKVVPDLDPQGERVARLRGTVGYWNALATLAAMAAPLALWLAVRRAHALWLRACGALLLYVVLVALLLTYSRGGVLVGLLAIAAWVVVGRSRFESLVLLAVVAPISAVVTGIAFALPGVSSDGEALSTRRVHGLVFGAALVAGGALVVLATRFVVRAEPFSASAQQKLLRAGRYALVGLAVVAVVGLAAARANPVDWVRDAASDFTESADPATAGNPERFLETSSSARSEWWGESWELFVDDPLKGAGAGSFDIARRPLRNTRSISLEPHNVPLQFLGELGLVGFALWVGTVALALAAAVAGVRRLEGADRAAATALALVVPTYLVHSLLDVEWDFVALSAPFFLVAGFLVAVGRPFAPQAAPARLVAAGAALLAVAAVVSLTSPWLAERRTAAADDALIDGDSDLAAERAESAHGLNPLAVEPLHLWAEAEEARQNYAEARELYVEAVELQPLNARTWRELGRYELQTLTRLDYARRYLARAGELDPQDPSIERLLADAGNGG